MFKSILLIAVAGGLAWLLLRLFPGRGKARTGMPGVSPKSHPYHAVSIHTGSSGCPPAKALKQKRFLSGEAPQLPLAECTSQKCHCVYQHHTDRRSGNGNRRAIGSAAVGMLRGDGERRRTSGRRKIDNNDDLSWV